MTSLINLIELATGQAGKEILINENFARLESFNFSVLGITNTPPVSPAELDTYIIGTSPTGVWVGYANHWTTFVNGGWVVAPPDSRFILFNNATSSFYQWDGSSWDEVTVGGGGGSSSPLTTDGDIYYRNGGVDTRLPKATTPYAVLSARGANEIPLWRRDPGIEIESKNAGWSLSGVNDAGKLFFVDTSGSNITVTCGANVSFLSYRLNFYFLNTGSNNIVFSGSGWTFPTTTVIPPNHYGRAINTGGEEMTLITHPLYGVEYQRFGLVSSDKTLQPLDHGEWVRCHNGNLTITLPDGLPNGFQAIIDRQGTQTVTVTATTTLLGKNVTANSVPIANQYGVVHVVHTGSNIWRIVGDL
jgi:hypothetical protein